MKNDYDKRVELICPICGSKTFKYNNEDDMSDVTCISCNKIFSRDELFESNQENLNINLDELKQELLHDTSNDIKKMLKNTFGKNYK